jgi:ubiquinone biosynthesis protein UbiJ
MASELRLTTLANNAGTESVDTTYVINGSAKAWINFNGQSTNIRGSLNVSSQTDVSTGRDQIAFTNSLGDAGYAMGVVVGDVNANSTTAATQRTAQLLATSGYDMNTVFVSGGTSGLGDYAQTLHTVFGDLA